MPGAIRSRLTWIGCSLLLLSLVSGPAVAQIRFDLPAQPLAQALLTVGNLANVNVFFDPTIVKGLEAPALKAELTADAALVRILAGTRLHAVRVDDHTIRVISEPTKHAEDKSEAPTGAVPTLTRGMLGSVAAAAPYGKRLTRFQPPVRPCGPPTGQHSLNRCVTSQVLSTARRCSRRARAPSPRSRRAARARERAPERPPTARSA